MYNKIILLGHATKNAELRYTPSGTPILNFTIATNHSYKSGDEWKKETLFMDCVIFGKFAEYLANNISKGTSVFATGRLQEQKWEREGVTQKKIQAILDEVKVLNAKAKEETKVESDESDLEPF